MTITFLHFVITVATGTLLLLSNVHAASGQPHSTSVKGKRQRGTRIDTDSKKKKPVQVPIDLSDFDPLDIFENDEEERLLSALESIDREEEEEVKSKTKKAKKKKKSKKLQAKLISSNAPTEQQATKAMQSPALEIARPVASSTIICIEETPEKNNLDVLCSSVEATQHLNQPESSRTDSTNLIDEQGQSPIKQEYVAVATRTTVSPDQQGHHQNQPEVSRFVPRSSVGGDAMQHANAPGSELRPAVSAIKFNVPERPYHRSAHPYPPRPSISSQHEQQPQQLRTFDQFATMADQRSAMLAYTTPWVIDYVRARPKDALLAVPRDFIGDGFNLVHLPPVVERLSGSNDMSFPLYKAALRVILNTEQPQDIPLAVQRAAETLYALVHGRYVTSPRGLDTVRRILMHDKDAFGKCPRPSCRGMAMLPHGESAPGRNSQRYCCSCGQVWECWDSMVDGSAWGSSFCHLYLLTYGKGLLGGGDRITPHQQNPTATAPTIFGFYVHPAALRKLHDRR